MYAYPPAQPPLALTQLLAIGHGARLRWVLPADEVHIWHANLTIPAAQIAALRGSLSPDELERAARLHTADAQRRWVAGRGIVRHLLAGYLGVRPSAITFAYTAHGKPELAHPGSRLHFNLAHTADRALLAISTGRALGVDLEPDQPGFDYQPLVDQLFAEAERAALAALPVQERGAAFVRIWTCKEAFVKACGLGLSLPLSAIEIAAAPGAPARLRRLPSQLQPARWSLHELAAGAGHQAALVVAGRDWRAREFAVR